MRRHGKFLLAAAVATSLMAPAVAQQQPPRGFGFQ